MPCPTLATVLAEHAQDTLIDLTGIDVEGGEAAVLRGDDWSRFRPAAVLS